MEIRLEGPALVGDEGLFVVSFGGTELGRWDGARTVIVHCS